jgi:DNA-binding CsgD family transcriptional regulator
MPASSRQLQKASLRLGEAVLDPGVWPDLMDEICRSINAVGALLIQSDVRTSDVPRTKSIDEAITRYFRDGWHMHDVRARGASLLLAGTPVVTDEDVTTPDEMKSHPFYNDAVFPTGLHWWAGVGFRSGSGLWALGIQRTRMEGPFSQVERRLLATLSQSLTEVATLSTAVGQAVLASSTSALDAVHRPAIAIDHFGFVLGVNTAVQRIFGADIGVRGKRLWFSDPQARGRLEDLIQQMTAGSDLAPLSGPGPIVVRRKDKSPIVVDALPVPAAARSPFLGARVILTLVPVEPKPRPDAALIARTFGLTPAEAKLAAALANGTSLEDAAEELHISRETARSQLKVVFAKTGTHRQSGLVALLSSIN